MLSFVETSLSERLSLVESLLKKQQADGRLVDSLNYDQELIIENGYRDVVVERNIDSNEVLSKNTKKISTELKELSPDNQHQKKKNRSQKNYTGVDLQTPNSGNRKQETNGKSDEKIVQKINEERKSYAEGLTIHGLNRIVVGGSLNRIVWTVLVIASFVVAVLISKDHFDAYLTRQSRTNSRFITEKTTSVPAVTVCDRRSLIREKQNFEGRPPVFPRPTVTSVDLFECGRNLSSCRYNQSAFINVEHYTSDYVYIKSLIDSIEIDNFTNCFTIRGLTQKIPSNLISITITTKRTKVNYWNEIFVNPPSETFHGASELAHWTNEAFYDIKIRKRTIKLLGLPYTDCVKGAGSYSQNKFSGNYTITKCKKGCFLERVFEKCGAIPPMYKKHLREPQRFENKTLVNNTFGQACMKTIENDEKVTTDCDAICELRPCYEEQIITDAEFNRFINPNVADIAFSYPSFMVEIIEEVPAYTWQDLFSNFGGCVGLMTGASILSLFELCIFFGLLIFDHFDIYTKLRPRQR